MKAIGYARVSTAEQARSGLGLEAQERAIRDACAARGWDLVDIWRDQVSGRDKSRQGLSAALDRLRVLDGGGALVCARLDRLTRSLAHLSELIDLADEEGWALVALDLGLDTSTDTGRLVARIMGSVAQWERERISARISEALQEKLATGWRPGGPGIPPEIVAGIVKMRQQGLTFQGIADRLNEVGVPTARGGTWRVSTVAKVCHRLEAGAAP